MADEKPTLASPARRSNRPPLVSPLKQVNETYFPRVTKFASSWAQLTNNPSLFIGQSTARFFSELFCLGVSPEVLANALKELSTEELLGAYKNNITQLFTNAVRVLKEASRDDVRRHNVVETLIPFLRNVLSRPFSNFSFEVMTLLSGSLERSDHVFTDLVSAIDLTLQDTSLSTELRHRTLQLALVIVSSVNQHSLTAYFLRRDLFSTLAAFMSDPATSPFTFESVLLLSLLANFRKFEARNPYLVRIEDFVDEIVMGRIARVVLGMCGKGVGEYVAITDDQPASFVASLTSLVRSLSLTDLLGAFSLSLPPPPESSSAMRKGKGKEVEEGVGAKKGRREEGAFSEMPPQVIAVLLPFYDLLNSNKSFGTLVFADTDDGPSALPPALISLSSYVLTHGANSSRARAYARLCLIILVLLVEEGEGKLTVEGPPLRMCRQRLPMLPPREGERRVPIAAMLDAALIFLRHNLHRRLDVETYRVCLTLVQRIMQQLKSERVRLEYDWVSIWRSILSLSSFIVSHDEELRVVSQKVDDLISQIFTTLSYAVYWGESFFPTTSTSVLLHYELLHADQILSSLSSLLPDPSNPKTSSSSTIHSSISFFTTKVDDVRAKNGEDELEAEDVMRVIEEELGGVGWGETGEMGELRRWNEGEHEAYFRALSGVVCTDALALVPTE